MTQEGDYIITSKDQFKERYINEKVEQELIEFKQEIEKKFQSSRMRDFNFPRKSKRKEHHNEEPFDYVEE